MVTHRGSTSVHRDPGRVGALKNSVVMNVIVCHQVSGGGQGLPVSTSDRDPAPAKIAQVTGSNSNPLAPGADSGACDIGKLTSDDVYLVAVFDGETISVSILQRDPLQRDPLGVFDLNQWS